MLWREGGGEERGPLLCFLLCQGPNSFLSLCYALWPLSNLGFSLSHTAHQGHYRAHDSSFSVSLWMHLFSKTDPLLTHCPGAA